MLRAAEEAGDFQAAKMAAQTEEIRNWLSSEGGMKVTRPDRTKFVAAAMSVQDEFAVEGGEDFQKLLAAIRAAGE